MRHFLLLITLALVISCPRPAIQQVPEPEYLKEAARIYQENPLLAYNMIKDRVTSPQYLNERNELILKLYLDQREYERAAILLDSTDWTIPLTPLQRNRVLLETQNWQRIIVAAEDPLLIGMAYYNLQEYEEAITLLDQDNTPDDYRLLYLAKSYMQLDDYDNALNAILRINSVSNYLFDEYQSTLFDILLELSDLDIVQAQLGNLKDPALRTYIMLRVNEKRKNREKVIANAWDMIINHPEAPGAYSALDYVKPANREQHRAYGRVLYYNNQYQPAIYHLKRGTLDDATRYYLGRIYYARNANTEALEYFSSCSWSAAYYYRGRIYERMNQQDRAMSIYDTLAQLRKGSEYAVRGLKRKAFLLEELGDTLNAVETFLSINERHTKFRAAMQLFKIGDLRKTLQVLQKGDSPEFIYWQIRVGERLGEPVDSLRQYLPASFPLSYYTLARLGRTQFQDTLPLNSWINQFDDTTLSFTRLDSTHLANAIRLFSLGEYKYAVAELRRIEADNAQDLLYLSKLCAELGADEQSIRYCLSVKGRAEARNIYRLPRELLRLQYPIRYAITITDNYPELSLALAMIWQESLFNPHAVSPANAKGLMQIIPSTAKMIASDLGIAEYEYANPISSIRFGLYYFRKMLQEFNSVPLSLAAYNAGPIRVRRWVSADANSEMDTFIELIPYDETREYVKLILARQQIYKYLMRD